MGSNVPERNKNVLGLWKGEYHGCHYDGNCWIRQGCIMPAPDSWVEMPTLAVAAAQAKCEEALRELVNPHATTSLPLRHTMVKEAIAALDRAREMKS